MSFSFDDDAIDWDQVDLIVESAEKKYQLDSSPSPPKSDLTSTIAVSNSGNRQVVIQNPNKVDCIELEKNPGIIRGLVPTNNLYFRFTFIESYYHGQDMLCFQFKSHRYTQKESFSYDQTLPPLPIQYIDPTVIEAVSHIQGYHYDNKIHYFYIDFKFLDEFEATITHLIPSHILSYTKVPPVVKTIYRSLIKHQTIRTINDVSRSQEDTTRVDIKPIYESITSRLPTELMATLKPFQLDSLVYTITRQGRILLADAPGLGKTIQSIAISMYYRQHWPLLIIVPSSVRLMWASEFEKWVPSLTSSDINVIMTAKGDILSNINITSYGLIDKLAPKIQGRIGMVICDESHLLKSWNSKRTQAIQPILRASKIALLLSGTPATSKPSELFPQIQSLYPHIFGTFMPFAQRYCDPKPRPIGGMDFSGSANLKELHAILNESMMVRRTKDEVLNELPVKRRHMVLLDIPSDQKKIIKEISSKLRDKKRVTDDIKKDSYYKHSIIFELFRNTGRAKMPNVMAYLHDKLNENHKILIFAHHQDIIEGIEVSLLEKQVECIRIDGRTPGYARQDLIDYFQTRETCRVAILSITAAGVGVTLTKADTVIFAELFWNPGILTQAEDRAHRYGQENEVDIYYMVAKGTIDERVWDVIESKMGILGETFDGEAKKLDLDSKKVNSNVGTNTNSFLQYLLEKMKDYEERIEEGIERYDIRKKVREEERNRKNIACEKETINNSKEEYVRSVSSSDHMSCSDRYGGRAQERNVIKASIHDFEEKTKKRKRETKEDLEPFEVGLDSWEDVFMEDVLEQLESPKKQVKKDEEKPKEMKQNTLKTEDTMMNNNDESIASKNTNTNPIDIQSIPSKNTNTNPIDTQSIPSKNTIKECSIPTNTIDIQSNPTNAHIDHHNANKDTTCNTLNSISSNINAKRESKLSRFLFRG